MLTLEEMCTTSPLLKKNIVREGGISAPPLIVGGPGELRQGRQAGCVRPGQVGQGRP